MLISDWSSGVCSSDLVQDALVLSRKEESPAEGDDHHEPLPLIGRSAAMQEVYRTIARVVPNDLTVLVLGESGTGKELLARAIYDLAPRHKTYFVALNNIGRASLRERECKYGIESVVPVTIIK